MKATNIKEAVAKALEVTELDLSGQSLKRFPTAVQKLRNLQILRLQGNVLSDLPEWLAELPLQQLDYSGNRLAEPDIGDMQSLTRLHVCPDVSKKAEEFVPDALAQLAQLEELSLVNIDFSSIPPWFAKLTGLRRLYLFGRRMTELPQVLAELPQLEEVHLLAPQLNDRTAAVQALVPNAKLSLN